MKARQNYKHLDASGFIKRPKPVKKTEDDKQANKR